MNATSREFEIAYVSEGASMGDIRYQVDVFASQHPMAVYNGRRQTEWVDGLPVSVLEPFLSLKELAKMLKLSTRTIQRYNRFPAIERSRYLISGKVFYKTVDFLRGLKEINKA